MKGHTSFVAALAILPSNENICSGSWDNTIKVWSSITFKLITSLEGHTSNVYALAILPSNENIVSGSWDSTIKIWDSKTFKSIATLNSKNESKRLSLTDTEHKLATFHEIYNNQSNTNSEEIYFHSDIETDRIVKKLKAKFDNVDESFVKVEKIL